MIQYLTLTCYVPGIVGLTIATGIRYQVVEREFVKLSMYADSTLVPGKASTECGYPGSYSVFLQQCLSIWYHHKYMYVYFFITRSKKLFFIKNSKQRQCMFVLGTVTISIQLLY